MKTETFHALVRLAVKILLIVFGLWFVFSFVFLVAQVKDNEMYPSIKAGDLVIGYRLQDNYEKDDVVIFRDPNTKELVVGRIAGKGNDTIQISSEDDGGELFVNGTLQTGNLPFKTVAKAGGNITYPFTVDEGCYFVLKDYRTNATDSRDFGEIKRSDVICKVLTILRRRDI